MPDPFADLKTLDLDTPIVADRDPFADLRALDLTPPEQTENNARSNYKFSSKLASDLHQAGVPQTEALPDFDPPVYGGRRYLSEHSGGLLDLNLDTVSPTRLDTAAINLQNDFLAKHPATAQIISSDDASKARLAAHHRQLAAIQEVPTTPREKLNSLSAAWSDWSTANISDRQGQPLYPARTQVPGQVASNILSKLVDTEPAADQAERTLKESTLDPNEKAAFQAMGGWDSVYFAQRHERYYTVRDRASRLTGQPVQPPQQPHTIYPHQGLIAAGEAIGQHVLTDDTVPRKFDLGLETLSPISSFSRGALAAGQQLAVAQAQAAADANNSYGSPLLRAYSESVLNQPSGEDAFNKTTAFERFSDRLAGLTVGPVAAGAAKVATEYAPIALNAALLNIPATVAEGVGNTLEAVGQVTTGDKEGLRRGYQYAKQSLVRKLALGGDETDKSLVKNADDLFAAFPDADPNVRIDLGAQYFPASTGVDSLLRRIQASKGVTGYVGKVLGLSTPVAREQLGAAVDTVADSADALVMAGTGVYGLYNWARRGFTPKVLKDPARKFTYTEFEKGLGEAGSYSSAPVELRAKMLDPIIKEIEKIKTPSESTALLDRIGRTLKQYDAPISPEAAASFEEAAARVRKIDDPLADTKISKAHKAALRDLAPQIADLPAMDQQFILRNDEAYINPEQSARRVDRGLKWLKAQAATSDVLAEPTGLGTIALDELRKAQSGLLAENARVADFTKRQYRLLEVTGTLRSRLVRLERIIKNQVESHLDLAEGVSRSWNDFIAGEADLANRIETQGVPADTPNPATRTARFKSLSQALAEKNIPALEELFKNDAGWKSLKLTLEQNASLGAAEGTLQQNLSSNLLEWARREHKNSLTPVQTVLGPSEPSGLHAGLQKKLEFFNEQRRPLELTPAERGYLNKWRKARGLEPMPAKPVHLKSIVDTAEGLHKRLLNAQEALKDVTSFRDALIKADPETGFQVPGNKEVLARIRSKLAEPEHAFVGDKYATLSLDKSQAELTGLQAYDEALSRYSAEHHRLQSGFQKISSIEMAFISSQNPALLRPILEDTYRRAQGDINTVKARVDELEHTFGKKYTEQQRRQIFEDAAAGRENSHEAAVLIQTQRMDALRNLFDAGVITADQFHSYMRADYYHGYYSPEAHAALDQAVKLQPPLRSARYSPLAVDSSDFLGFKIPDEGYYIAHRSSEGAPLQYITEEPGTAKKWQTPEAVRDWLDSGNHLPEGSQVSIRAPRVVSDKELAGMIREPFVSHADLMYKIGHVVGRTRVTSLLADTPHVSTHAKLLERAAKGEGTFSKDAAQSSFTNGKTTWRKVTNPKIPHLDGKYINDLMLGNLQLYEESMPWVKSITEAAAEDIKVQGNPLAGPFAKIFLGTKAAAAYTLKTAANVFAVNKILLSAPAIRNNLLTNTVLSRYCGLNPIAEPVKFMKYNAEYFKVRYGAKGTDVYMDALYSKDLIRRAGAPGGDVLARNIDKHWNSVAALDERARRLELEAEAHLAAGRTNEAARASAQALDLKDKSAAQAHVAYKGMLKTLYDHGRAGVNQIYEMTQGRGKLNAAGWNVYGEIGLDNSVKYANLKYLVEEKGFTMEDALRRVETFTQQLHRVPKFVKNATNKFGGAMFTSYPVEQMRILGNILKHEPGKFLGDIGMILGANSAVLAAQGINERDFLESYALDLGLRRSFLTDLMAMGGRLLVPTSEGGVSSMSVGPYMFDAFAPQSKAGREIAGLFDTTTSKIFGKGLLGAAARGVTNAVVGAASKFALSDLGTEAIRAIVTSTDNRGDPIRDAHDGLRYLYTLFAPPGLPGTSEFKSVANVMGDKEINPRTGKKTTVPELVANLALRARPFLDSPSRFQAAMTSELKASDQLYTFQRQILYDDMLSTLLARGGARKPDGTLDHEAARPIIEKFYADHPASHLDPETGEPAPNRPDPDRIKNALKANEYPGAVASFSRLPLEKQMRIYSLWRSVDRDAPKTDSRWSELIRDSIQSKLESGRAQSYFNTRAIQDAAKEWIDSGQLPQDAVNDLRNWSGRAIYAFTESPARNR